MTRTSEIGVDAALHADFCGAAVPGLSSPSGDLGVGQQVGGASQLLSYAPLAEGTEAAPVCAPVGVVYVPVGEVSSVGGLLTYSALMEVHSTWRFGESRVEAVLAYGCDSVYELMWREE